MDHTTKLEHLKRDLAQFHAARDLLGPESEEPILQAVVGIILCDYQNSALSINLARQVYDEFAEVLGGFATVALDLHVGKTLTVTLATKRGHVGIGQLVGPEPVGS